LRSLADKTKDGRKYAFLFVVIYRRKTALSLGHRQGTCLNHNPASNGKCQVEEREPSVTWHVRFGDMWRLFLWICETTQISRDISRQIKNS